MTTKNVVLTQLGRKNRAMDDLTSGQEEVVAATVGAIQRIAMAMVELPTEERAAHYAMVRRKFEAVMTEVGIEGATAHAWLNSTMDGIESLVSEIEAGGGAAGGLFDEAIFERTWRSNLRSYLHVVRRRRCYDDGASVVPSR